jgi:hypothetical protein
MNEAIRIEYNDTQQDGQYGYEEGTVLIVHRYERYLRWNDALHVHISPLIVQESYTDLYSNLLPLKSLA